MLERWVGLALVSLCLATPVTAQEPAGEAEAVRGEQDPTAGQESELPDPAGVAVIAIGAILTVVLAMVRRRRLRKVELEGEESRP